MDGSDARGRAETPTDASGETAAQCTSCGALLHGRFCHACGQETIAQPDSLSAFLFASFSDVVNFRSRTLRSLFDLVFRPGELTAAWFRGQRVRYTQPVQLYLIAAAIFFLANSYRPFVVITEDNRILSSLGALMVGQSLDDDRLAELETTMTLPVFRERFQVAVSQSLPPFMVGSIVAFALALWLFSPRRPALMHVIFALHWTGFYLFIMSLERLVPSQPGTTSGVGGLLVIAALIHLMLALRRTYAHGWPRAVASTLGLVVIFNLILAGWVMAVVEFAHRQAL